MNWQSKLEEIKRKLNLKTSELAKKVEIPSQSIIDLEKGRVKNPSANLIKGLILKLNINPFWLFESNGVMFINEIPEFKENELLKSRIKEMEMNQNEKLITIKDALPILEKLSKLNNQQKKSVIKYIESLYKDNKDQSI